MKTMNLIFGLLCAAVMAGCSRNVNPSPPVRGDDLLALSDVAGIVSELPLEKDQLDEVYDAVNSSSGHGYDEEYTMSHLFSDPGSGVGDSTGPTKSSSYRTPLKKLFADYFQSRCASKSGLADAEAYIRSLSESDIQIYWPYSENWDGMTYPIITFDPGFGAESNYGYMISFDKGGARVVDSVLVTEAVAQSRPVWVINRNDDSAFTPLDMFSDASPKATAAGGTGGGDIPKTLSIRSMKMLRNYDSWFCGASEFFIKCGAPDGFRAKTDEELKLFTASVTDFMVVIKRSQVNRSVDVNTIMLTDFTPQMDKIVFMITEDDGGKVTSWKCQATVKFNSKSYGFDIDIPYRDKDDIVWRGQLSGSFFGSRTLTSGRFGDVAVTFELK